MVKMAKVHKTKVVRPFIVKIQLMKRLFQRFSFIALSLCIHDSKKASHNDKFLELNEWKKGSKAERLKP